MLEIGSLLARVRGRGIARLIRGLTEGDPVSWAIFGGIVVVAGGWYGFKYYKSRQELTESE